MRLIAAGALALATVIATPALAQEEGTSFSGPSVTAIVGYDHVAADGDNGNGATFGGALGYDARFNNFVLGGEVEGTFATTEQCVAATCVEAGRDLYAGLRAGVVVSPNSMIYVKGGYTNARVELTDDGDTLAGNNLDGLRLGVGAEYNANSGFLVRVEYRYSNYEADVTRHQAVLGVGYRF